MQTIPEELQHMLRNAMRLELTTIPAYLYAYWSIKTADQGGTPAAVSAARTIMSVVDEEMLHMALVSNILNALGGTPALTDPQYLPTYPGFILPKPQVLAATAQVEPLDETMVYLYPLSTAGIELFMRIELPEWDVPEKLAEFTYSWKTIGAFYAAIQQILDEHPELNYQGGRQLPEYDNPGVGRLYSVASLEDARQALDLIVEQGEGVSKDDIDDGCHELAHYWKFDEINQQMQSGLIDLQRDVYAVVPNPDGSVYTPEQQHANLVFNSTYSDLLDALQATFSSDKPDVFAPTAGYAPPVSYMEQLTQLAAVLRNQGNVPGTAYVAGPTFAYIAKADRIYQ